MLLASLLVPIAVALIVLLVQRIRLPAFLAIMATVVVYGIAADMTFQSIGKAFGLGFTNALEQVGLLVVAGALAGAVLLRTPLGTGTSAVAGALAGLGGSAAGGLALLQPAGQDALSRDKTRTQVFEISELGLVEMTRKRIGEGLLTNFADTCTTCEGRGIMVDHSMLD